MSDTTNTKWFNALILILSLFILGFSIANIVYYTRIRNSPCTTGSGSPITNGEALAMIIVNSLILIVSLIFIFIALWRLFFTKSSREYISQQAVLKAQQAQRLAQQAQARAIAYGQQPAGYFDYGAPNGTPSPLVGPVELPSTPGTPTLSPLGSNVVSPQVAQSIAQRMSASPTVAMDGYVQRGKPYPSTIYFNQ